MNGPHSLELIPVMQGGQHLCILNTRSLTGRNCSFDSSAKIAQGWHFDKAATTGRRGESMIELLGTMAEFDKCQIHSPRAGIGRIESLFRMSAHTSYINFVGLQLAAQHAMTNSHLPASPGMTSNRETAIGIAVTTLPLQLSRAQGTRAGWLLSSVMAE